MVRRSALDAARAAASERSAASGRNRSGGSTSGTGRTARTYGVAGGSVGDAGTAWANNKEVVRHGTAGEVKTGDALERGLGKRVVILHDVSIPITGFKANIDHLVVSGSTVTIIDAKSWAGGFYWTRGGVTRRGFERFEPAEKQTMVLAAQSIGRYLERKGLNPQMATPVVAVWSTSGRASLWAARFPGANLINGERLQAKASKICGRDEADPNIVDALVRLVR